MRRTPEFKELRKFIDENHPQSKDVNQAQLDMKLQWICIQAIEEFFSCISQGYDCEYAEKMKNKVLYKYVLFLPVDYVKDILNEKYGLNLTRMEALPYYREVKDVFQNFETSEEDFMGSASEIKLRNKIIKHFKTKKQ